MQTGSLVLFIVFGLGSQVSCQDVTDDGNLTFSNETSSKVYLAGVDSGIINSEKYSFQSFLKDEQTVFRDSYREYVSMNGTEPINYEKWLVMNNFGILPDTQESLFERKLTTRSTANKRRFVNTVRKGDILITERGLGGLIGHAAIMATDHWVVEMPGILGWPIGIEDNNRRVRKDKWFDEYGIHWTTVYRCPDKDAANDAAVWAYHAYYNPSGGAKKTRHINFWINTDLQSTNPSYCSKLVVQAYYYGTGKKSLMKNMSGVGVIVPFMIPSYFNKGQLVNKGKY